MTAGLTLVIDVGTSSSRAVMLGDDGAIVAQVQTPTPPITPMPGLVEFDAERLATTVIDMASALIASHGPARSVAITTQRASTVIWDARTSTPLAPALGWQDLRTIGECLTANAEHDAGIAPNQTATKAQWLLATTAHEASRTKVGTLDSWLMWRLGGLHLTDPTQAAITGLTDTTAAIWDPQRCALFGVDPAMLPDIVDTVGTRGAATALPGAPTIVASVGDQQASMAGQGCVVPGRVKMTFGTGGMADVVTGPVGPSHMRRSNGGTFPIATSTTAGTTTWGAEAVILSAGSCVEWLCEDLGIIDTPENSHTVASACTDTGGVTFVPALMGLGTPQWDFGARGTLLGLTRGSERSHIVRAVLDGVAHRGADLIDALESDTGTAIDEVRVDGGMSHNPTFIAALARATRRPVLVSEQVEATAIGAGRLAQVADGVVPTVTDLGDLAAISHEVHPSIEADVHARERDEWRRAVTRAGEWIPELSALDF
jgi:glycerol kinase